MHAACKIFCVKAGEMHQCFFSRHVHKPIYNWPQRRRAIILRELLRSKGLAAAHDLQVLARTKICLPKGVHNPMSSLSHKQLGGKGPDVQPDMHIA